MFLSVVIITYNRKALLQTQIQAIDAMSEGLSGDFEIIYVDNRSMDGTTEELARLCSTRPNIRVFREEQQGSSFARNRGAAEARGEYLWYLDDDSLPLRGALAAYLEALPKWGPEVATGPIIPKANTRVPWWFDVESKQLGNYLARCDYGAETRILEKAAAWGPNLVIRKDAFEQAGGFNKKLGVFGEGRGGGEEDELQRRIFSAGGKLLYVHDAPVEHLILPKQMVFSNYLKQRYHRGGSEAQEMALRGKRVAGAVPTALKIVGHAGASIPAAATGRIALAVDHVGACCGLYGKWVRGRELDRAQA